MARVQRRQQRAPRRSPAARRLRRPPHQGGSVGRGVQAHRVAVACPAKRRRVPALPKSAKQRPPKRRTMPVVQRSGRVSVALRGDGCRGLLSIRAGRSGRGASSTMRTAQADSRCRAAVAAAGPVGRSQRAVLAARRAAPDLVQTCVAAGAWSHRSGKATQNPPPTASRGLAEPAAPRPCECAVRGGASGRRPRRAARLGRGRALCRRRVQPVPFLLGSSVPNGRGAADEHAA